MSLSNALLLAFALGYGLVIVCMTGVAYRRFFHSSDWAGTPSQTRAWHMGGLSSAAPNPLPSSDKSASINIVQGSLADLDRVALLFDRYRQFYGQMSNLSAASEFLRKRLEQNQSVIFLAAGPPPERAALGFTQLYPSFSSEAVAPLWILNDLFVSESARRHGVARALLERVRRHALETGAERLVLETAVDNLAAQALYEKLGWKRDDEYYRYYLRL